VTIGRVLRDLRWGLKHGLRLSTLVGIIVALMVAFDPQVEVRGHSLQLWRILGGYLLGGLLAGLSLGLLRSQFYHRGRAILAGAFVGTVVYSSMDLALFGPGNLDFIAAVIPGVFIGGIAGFALAEKRPNDAEQI